MEFAESVVLNKKNAMPRKADKTTQSLSLQSISEHFRTGEIYDKSNFHKPRQYLVIYILFIPLGDWIGNQDVGEL